MHPELNLAGEGGVSAAAAPRVAGFDHSRNVERADVVQLDGPIPADGGRRVALGLAHHQGQDRPDVGRVGFHKLEAPRGGWPAAAAPSSSSSGSAAATVAAAAQTLPEFDVAILAGGEHVAMLGGADGTCYRRPVEVGYLVMVGRGDVGRGCGCRRGSRCASLLARWLLLIGRRIHREASRRRSTVQNTQRQQGMMDGGNNGTARRRRQETARRNDNTHSHG